MSIIQISKIQVRSGNLVDLPQLSEAEFGWASDSKKLFIGKTTPNENVELLTSYSTISFSQIDGSGGNNLNISNAQSGQILSFDGTDWVNKGGNAAGLITLGDISNVKINGGTTGYVLATDGTGNLSWTPKSAVVSTIVDVTQADPAVVTTEQDNFFTEGAEVTITEVLGMTQLNGNSYYVDVLTSNTFALYSDALLTASVNSIPYTTYISDGRVIAPIGSGGGTLAAGANTAIQFNNTNLLDGSPNFTYDFANIVLTVNGNITSNNSSVSGNVSTSRLISNVATGTSPLVVTSTTQVANLNSATSGAVINNAQPNITSVGTLTSLAVTGNVTSGNATLGNLTTSNYFVGNGSLLTGLVAGNISGTVATSNYAAYAGNVTLSGQANITSVGTLTSLAVTGNISGANLTGTHYGAATGLTSIPGANVTGTVANATYATSAGSATTATTAGTVTTAAQPAITSLGTLSSLSVTGNISGANLTGTHYGAATGLTSIPGANVTGTVANATYATSAGSATTATTAGSATTAGTVTTAAQTAITSLGTLSSLSVTANTTTGGIKTDNYYYANGVSISFAGAYSNSNVAAYLPTYTGQVGTGAATHYGTSLTTGANTTAGTITGNWALSAGSRLNATYADLAEYYESDVDYAPGTVLEFGGANEVTMASDETTRVAGVVSTNPAYVLNTQCPGIAVMIALQGRVPCKVRGKINKGDLMVSGGNGYARPTTNPKFGTIIGKALSNFDGTDGIIEIAVGRL